MRQAMVGKRRHASWMDMFQEYPIPAGISEKQAHKNTFKLDDILHEHWNLGRNLIQLWAKDSKGMFLLVIPHYRLEEFAAAEHLIDEVLMGSKQTTLENLKAAAKIFKTDVIRIKLPFTPGEGLSEEMISALLQRFSISLIKDRAVALFDIAGFSLLSPLEQVTQLNSLSYSVNSAHNKLMKRSINIHFSRSSTGDGFYIWNRARGRKANIDLFDLLQLILADNSIAQRKANGKTVPVLKTCFNIGTHYEYHQAIGLNPSTISYIVGDVSIELARMIEQCQPNQILIRDFDVIMNDAEHPQEIKMNTIDFIKQVQNSEIQLQDVVLSGEKVESIDCYLTGSAGNENSATRKYHISDKHSLIRSVYNVQVDISLFNAATVSLGLPPSELAAFESLQSVQVQYAELSG